MLKQKKQKNHLLVELVAHISHQEDLVQFNKTAKKLSIIIDECINIYKQKRSSFTVFTEASA